MKLPIESLAKRQPLPRPLWDLVPQVAVLRDLCVPREARTDLRVRRPVAPSQPTIEVRSAGTARRIFACAAPLLFGFTLCGCQDNGFRTEVKGNGQGGVDIKRVAKDPESVEEASAPRSTVAPQSRPASQDEDLRAKVNELQAQIDRQNQEIQRLKQTTSPATQP